MVRPEKFGHFHLVYYLTVPLKATLLYFRSNNAENNFEISMKIFDE